MGRGWDLGRGIGRLLYLSTYKLVQGRSVDHVEEVPLSSSVLASIVLGAESDVNRFSYDHAPISKQSK